MGFFDAISRCLRAYARFSGRAARSEFWWFVLFVLLGQRVAGAVDRMVQDGGTLRAPGVATGPLEALFTLAMAIPFLAAGWRRMHDSGRSGLHLLYPLIVVIGLFSFGGFAAGFGGILDGAAAENFGSAVTLIMVVSSLILIISPLLVIWWLTRPSQPGPNVYGPNPKEVAS